MVKKEIRAIMKKIFIVCLCVLMIWGNGTVVYALELDENLIQVKENSDDSGLIGSQKDSIESDKEVIDEKGLENNKKITNEEPMEDGKNTNEIDDLSKNKEIIDEEPMEDGKNTGEIDDLSKNKEIIDEEPMDGSKNTNEIDILVENKDTNQEEYLKKSEDCIQDITNIEEIPKDVFGDIEQVAEEEDPQYGRENGYLDGEIAGIETFTTGIKEYIHNERFANCIIKDVIDVSKYQGDIDWEKVKQSGIEYAIIRAGFRGYGEKASLNTDSYFVKNMDNAISAGVKVGVYFFSQAITEEEAIAEAKYVLALIEGYEINLPIVIDFEYASSIDGLIGRLYEAKLTVGEATKICRNFCETVENSGYTAMIYANKGMLMSGVNASELSKDYKIWLANYGTSTSYDGEYDFWQYTQSASINGILGNVDKSFWYEKSTAIYNGIDYSLVYDFNYYLKTYSDLKKKYENDDVGALEHFVKYGMTEGRQGCETFNVVTYQRRYSDLRRKYGKNIKEYYLHYVKYGAKEGRSGDGTSEMQSPLVIYNGIDYSLVYDFNDYLKRYSDLKKKYENDDVGALEHFVKYGMTEGRQGCETFNVVTYQRRYSDLRRKYGKNIKEYYLHYIKYGAKEGRSGEGTSEMQSPLVIYNGIDYSLVYDFNDYLKRYSDLKKKYENDDVGALEHFVKYGMIEGRQGCETFNVVTYQRRYSDLRHKYRKNIKEYYLHYVKYGAKEGRSGEGTSKMQSPLTIYNGIDYSLVYDFEYYLKRYSDLKKKYENDDIGALEHFVKYGMTEGRQGCEVFEVYTYRNIYQDLRNSFGDDLKRYYLHYINHGNNEDRRANNIGEILSCRIVEGSKENLTIKLLIRLNDSSKNLSEYYITQTDSYNVSINKVWASKEGISGDVSIDIVVLGKEAVSAALMDKFTLAIKDKKDGLIIASGSKEIENPEALASNTTAVYQGTSKKGLQGITFTSLSDDAGEKILDARNANTKHTLLNLDLASIVSPVPKAGFEAYTYKGNTYYFDELVSFRQSIESLNAGYKQYLYGNNETTKVAVSVCLLLSYNPETSYLIDPAARTPGHSYYTLNVREEKARETFEALFLYLGEAFGKGDQYKVNSCYVSNWILGNEINSSKAWNYSGSLDFDTYMDCYATAFRLLYNGVKSTKTGNTVCISLDNGWTAAPDTYAGKTVLDTFARKINQQNPNIKWSIAYHPYSYPLTRVDFWNDYSNTTDSLSTRYISMRNITVLTNYAASLEKTYGLPSGSIRVLLTEQGYSYSGGDVAQATAIARGFYIAQFNDRIDAFIIRSVVDDAEEAAGRLYFGLMNRKTEKRISFFVYEYMDSDIDRFKALSPVGLISDDNFGKFNKAKEIVCNTNWSSIVPGYNKAKLASIK